MSFAEGDSRDPYSLGELAMLPAVFDPAADVANLLSEMGRSAASAGAPRSVGRVCGLLGLELEVEGVDAAIGDLVLVRRPSQPLPAEVVAVRDGRLLCAPLGDLRGVRYGTLAEPTGVPPRVEVGWGLLGRVLDGLGRPIDELPRPPGMVQVDLDGSAPHPLRRRPVDTQLGLGVRAIDSLTPCGIGQRVGIFAGSGVGKSTLLGMMARGATSDICVLALVGERGREVAEFVERDLGPDGLARSVVVVATSDQPALVRIRAAFVATRIAEWFRDKGADVLLLVDSLTRLAMAQREVGLSAGEPPATRGYPPSAFGLLPTLLERAGTGEQGSITGLYTVLVEGDDMDEPIADAARSILDGHIVLSRKLATSGHFPAIEPLESISRVESSVTTAEQRRSAIELRRLLAARREVAELVEIGAYVPGSSPVADRALALDAEIEQFLCQDTSEAPLARDTWDRLASLVGPR